MNDDQYERLVVDIEAMLDEVVATLTNEHSASQFGIVLTDMHRAWLRERARNLLAWLEPALATKAIRQLVSKRDKG